MNFKRTLLALMALLLAASVTAADNKMEDKMEDSTEAPVVDFAVIEPASKISTERPPTVASTAQKASTSAKSDQPQAVQPHTVADFIIHPLIAFKPRAPEEDIAGKQAGDSSSTTPSPWSLFGFNAGQGLGSSVSNSVSNLAGSVSGWLTDRIQLPGLVESPVRESTTTSTTTTTTTTQRPDVVVRVQHKASTRPPLISITNGNRPQRFYNNNNNFVSDEVDDDEDLDEDFEEEEEVNKNKNKRGNNKNKPNRDEEDVTEEEEEEDTRPVRRPQQKRPQQQRRRRPVVVNDISEEEYDDDDDSQESADEDEHEDDDNVDDEDDVEEDNVQRPNIRRPQNNINRRRQQPQRRRLYAGQNFAVRRVQKPNESDEVEDDDEEFYYGYRPSTKRSQNEANFFQRGQENIINQLRQLTGGRTPAEISNLVRKSSKQSANIKPKRRQQTTLLVNRNGQTVYLAPELLNADLPFVNPQVHYLKQDGTQAPPKRKSAPTQYITIPWSQLGISPPDQLHTITEGVQTQPLILNIPASAIKTLQSQNGKSKKKPVITAEAVPLLAEASIMDVFKPPKIPHDRHTTDEATQKPSNNGMSVIIASKTKPNNGKTVAVLPQRIRAGTVVEKAPASADSPQEASEEMAAPESVRNVEKEYILVGEDNEPGLTRQVKPVYGEGRYVYGANDSPYLELLKQHARYALRRTGRELEVPAGEASNNEQLPQPTNGEQLITVQIINEPTEKTKEESEEQKETVQAQEQTHSEPEHAQTEAQIEAHEVKQQTLDGVLPVDVPVKEKKANESTVVA